MSQTATLSAVAVTLGAWTAAIVHVASVIASRSLQQPLTTLAGLLYIALITALVAGSLVYLAARYGYARRLAMHRPARDSELDVFRASSVPAVTILVPSYKEDPAVVWKTLLSAALQDYPRRSVVLLIDDPPFPTTAEDARALEAMRDLVDAVHRRVATVHQRVNAAAVAFEQRVEAGMSSLSDEARKLAEVLRQVATWFAREAYRHPILDHTDRVFVDVTFDAQSAHYREKAADILRCIDIGTIDVPLLRRAYRDIASRFNVTVRTFERKRYTNLSHEPNKAMNLNTYISLMGGRFRERADGRRLLLEHAGADDPGIAFDDSEYVVVLDADTIVHPQYVLRLAHCLSRPEHRRIAVIQTPYSAFPGADGLLESVAGATTDIQYQIHQGFTYFGATFWVGANAMIRKAALEDIVEVRRERGFPVRVFISDRTVIEDTESTVELRHRDWQLFNYTERMAYSATPPDFGALLIQRRRWANGGLLIVPKLWRFLWRHGLRSVGVSEVLLRLHYLASLAVANVALLVLLALSFDEQFASAWLPVTALPYYILYALDLRCAGYSLRDVLRVYALNLLLIPVSLGGIVRSMHQAYTGHRSAFGRTPKVAGRTAAPPGYVLAEAALLASWFCGALLELNAGRWLNGLFAISNGVFLLYAIIRFVGVREACEDVRPLAVRAAHALGTFCLALAPRQFVTPLLVTVAHLLPAAVMMSDRVMSPQEQSSGSRLRAAASPLPSGATPTSLSRLLMRERASDEPHAL